MAKPRAPKLPSNHADPAGIDPLERGAMAQFEKRLRACAKAYVDGLVRIPASPAVNAKYSFDLNQTLLEMVLSAASLSVDDILLEGGADNLWFTQAYGEIAYQRGTAQQRANLAQQSAAYAAERRNLATIINTQEYRLRIGLIKARQFEEIKGLAADVKADMSRVLTDGLARGLNPLEISRRLQQQSGLEQYKAYRIARTEIGTALDRAKLDEADAANAAFGTKTLQMHISALSPTTRKEHAARHGELYTTDQVREWKSEDGNSINCKCTSVAVMVDDEGVPLVPQIQERARATFKKVWDNYK